MYIHEDQVINSQYPKPGRCDFLIAPDLAKGGLYRDSVRLGNRTYPTYKIKLDRTL